MPFGLRFILKGETDKVSGKIADLPLEIKSDATSISQIAIPELKGYGDYMRRLILRGDTVKVENGSVPEIISKREEIDVKIKSLSRENGISKLKSQSSLVS